MKAILGLVRTDTQEGLGYLKTITGIKSKDLNKMELKSSYVLSEAKVFKSKEDLAYTIQLVDKLTHGCIIAKAQQLATEETSTISLESYKAALSKVNGISQCECFVTNEYFEQHKKDKYAVVITNGWSVATANEVFNSFNPRKYIGDLSELNKIFSAKTSGVNSRTIQTLFAKLIATRKSNECIVIRPLVKELDY
jgi:hypothetical protein